MNTFVTKKSGAATGAVHYRPAISLVMPFEPKMNGHSALSVSLRAACKKIEKELRAEYSSDIVSLMMAKLDGIISHLNFSTHKKSIAIYVSPVFEKVIYLDIPVEEKIFIDGSFEIRDLLYCKKQLHEYLVLQLSAEQSQVYIGNSIKFVRIVSAGAQTAAAPGRDLPEQTGNFSDAKELKEIQMHKFLRQVDASLDIILNAYPLPLFVLGPERLLGHFKKICSHEGSIINYVYGDYSKAAESDLAVVLAPYVTDWKAVLEKEIQNKMEHAAGARRLATGIHDVWREAHRGQGKLLLVEKNYVYTTSNDNSNELVNAEKRIYNKFSCTRNTIDDIIEEVLQNGGDVEFAPESLLKNYEHIALIKYY